MRRLSAIVTANFLLFSCQPQGKNKAQQISQKATPEPRQTDNWERARECAAQADRLAKRESWVKGGTKLHFTTEDWSNHYSPKYQRCYVWVTYSELIEEKHQEKIGPGNVFVFDELWDAFEQRMLGRCTGDTRKAIQGNFCAIYDGQETRFGCDACKQYIEDRMLH